MHGGTRDISGEKNTGVKVSLREAGDATGAPSPPERHPGPAAPYITALQQTGMGCLAFLASSHCENTRQTEARPADRTNGRPLCEYCIPPMP
jgi:hypothetical protein